MAYNKYSNKKEVRIVNKEKVVFDSKKEARRFDDLILLLKAGKISGLMLQPSFEIIPQVKCEGHRTMALRKYVADFRYVENGITIVEDVKGFKTDMYRIKKQLFLAKYGKEITFIET